MSEIQCSACGRIIRAGERIGYTCGDPMPIQFVPKSDDDFAADVLRFRLGLPSENMAGKRCLGVLAPDQQAFTDAYRRSIIEHVGE